MYYTLVWASCWLSSEESACRKKKKYACSAGDAGSIPGSGRSPKVGIGNLLQYSCLENPMNRGVWWGVYRVTELDMTEQLSRHTHTHTHTSLFLGDTCGKT